MNWKTDDEGKSSGGADGNSTPDDKELIKKVQAGDTEAFKRLMKRYFQELTDFALHYVKSPQTAKDVVQDVFANIWEKRDRWNPTRSLKMYLYQSVKNEALKEIRDRKIEQKYLRAYTDEKGDRNTRSPKPDDNNLSQFKQLVQRAIRELPERARMAYKLNRRDGLTYKEIAEVMEISHKTVESQISRALQILRDKLSSLR